MNTPQLWATYIAIGFVLCACLAWAAWQMTTPKGNHFHPGDGAYELERVWLSEDQLLDAVWRQENLRFEEAIAAYRRLTNVLQLDLSADSKTGAGPLVSSSKVKVASIAIESLTSQDAICDIEIVATWLINHTGKLALKQLVERALELDD